MIPGPLVLPTPVARLAPPRKATVIRVVGVLLVLVAVSGALSWVFLLSPLTLKRWNLFDSTLEFTAKEPGTYIIYEEGPGEASKVGPPLALISVRALSGRKIPTTSLIDDQGHSSVTYETPWHEGRGLVSFEIENAGTYELFAFPSPDASTGSTTNAAGTSGRFLDLSQLPFVAVGPVGVPGPLGGVGGLLLLVVTPAIAAMLVLAVAAKRWPSMLRRPRRRRKDRAGDGPTRGARRAGRREVKRADARADAEREPVPMGST